MGDEEDDPFERLGEDVDNREGDPFEHLTEEADMDESTVPGGDGTTADDGADERTPGNAEDFPETEGGPTSDFEVETDSSPSPGGPLGGAEGFDSGVESDSDGNETQSGEGARGNGEGQAWSDTGTGDTDAEEWGFGENTTADAPESRSGANGEVGPERGSDAGPASDTDLEGMAGREGDPFESLGSFEDRSVEGVDPDAVWQTLASAEARGSVMDKRDRSYADVSKHSYCEQCEYFSSPPDVHCRHEGTEIVEFLDMETVRVVDCPVVTERKQLEGQD